MLEFNPNAKYSFKKLDKLMDDVVSKKSNNWKILIGYKARGELMKDRIFFEEVVGSAMEPSKRKYKNIKIRVTQDDNLLCKLTKVMQ